MGPGSRGYVVGVMVVAKAATERERRGSLRPPLPGIVWQREHTEAILRGRGRSHAGQEVGWDVLGACWTVSRVLL